MSIERAYSDSYLISIATFVLSVTIYATVSYEMCMISTLNVDKFEFEYDNENLENNLLASNM